MKTTHKLRPVIMGMYDLDRIREAQENLSLRTRQLRSCESRLAELKLQESTLQALMCAGVDEGITTAASDELHRTKEDVLKLNGKSAKLHKEITQLKDNISRWGKLRDWSHGSK